MTYEIWNTKTRNLVAAFNSEETSWAIVQKALLDHGTEYVARLALVREDENGRSETIAIGRSLVEPAREAERHPGPTPVVLRPA